jgi:hypothetical protein
MDNTIVKNSWEYIKVEPTSYKDSTDLIDIRVYKKTRNEPKGCRTYKGLTIKKELIPDLVRVLQAV